MSPIPDTPPETDAEHEVIKYLTDKFDTDLPDWGVAVSLASSPRPYVVPLVTVKELTDATTPESVTNELDSVVQTLEVRVFADTSARKKRLLNKVKSFLQATSNEGLGVYCWLKPSTGANLDSLSQSEGIYQSTLNVNMTRYETPGEDIA